MSTALLSSTGLAETLFSRNRRAILSLLLARPDEEFYLRQIVRTCGGGMGAVQRELRQLVQAGILHRTVRHKQVYFQADPACPVFEELKNIVLKTAGMADVLRAELVEFGDRIDVAFIFGSMASGQPKSGSDVDLLIVGDISFAETVATLAEAQTKIGREINPLIYPREEFLVKIRSGHHFLQNVLKKKRSS